jgi:hypothetical protein
LVASAVIELMWWIPSSLSMLYLYPKAHDFCSVTDLPVRA